jgi:uncharacterized protein YjbJ (UPF0337 family)
MSNTSKRIEGAAEELGGRVKSTVGALLGNEQMQAEGHAQAAKGKLKQEAAKAAERVTGAVEEVTGTIKKTAGALLGNEQMQAEGALKEVKGQTRQQGNR